MLGPVLLLVGFSVTGAVCGGWAGAVAGAAIAGLLTAAVAASAVMWALHIGRMLEADQAKALAPRPPLFRRLCDWVYDRTLVP